MEPITFTDLKLNKQLVSAVEDLNYTTPSPIQIKAIPLIMAGHDVLGIAQTGTGKTAAYLLPMLMKIKYAQGNTPRGLVLAPTRELAMQMLKSRLYQLELEKRNAEIAKIESSKLRVDFGSQIRNYVLHPYKLVKDNRTSHETSDAQGVLDGGLNEFMKAFLLAQSEESANKD